MCVCYILYSPTLNKFYTGFTKENIDSRLDKHNTGAYGQHFTSQVNDWELYFTIECETISQALKIEKHIKSMKSSLYIRNLKKYPEISEKLLLKYK